MSVIGERERQLGVRVVKPPQPAKRPGRPVLFSSFGATAPAPKTLTTDQFLDALNESGDAANLIEVGGETALREAVAAEDKPRTLAEWREIITDLERRADGDGDAHEPKQVCMCGIGGTHADCCSGRGTGYQFGRPLPRTP